MADSNIFEDIMKEITRGLSGDSKKDVDYLQEQMEMYKDHEYGKEIIRACGRLIYEVIPDEKKKELEQFLGNDAAGFEAALEEVRFNHYKKNYDKALKLIEDMVEKYEKLDMFADDSVSEYHTFREPMEEIVYRRTAEPQKELRRATIDYSELYLQYGSILFEFQRWEDAEKALAKAMRWNPTYANLAFEHAETFKTRGLLEEYKDLTMDIFKIAFRPKAMARCYRNLSYYFIEKKEYEVAASCLLYSTQYENSEMVSSELYYISQMTGKIIKPSEEELGKCFEKYEIPFGPNPEFVQIAYAYGKQFYEQGDMETAAYFLEIVLGFVDDEEVRQMYEDAKEKCSN